MIESAVILSTGDELTTGKVVDTNSAFLADQLFSVGVRVTAVLKVGDNPERLLWALGRACELGGLIIGTGGLGPTADDLTSEITARFLGRKLIRNESVAAGLKKRFETRSIPWTDNNFKQALFPEGSTIVPNSLGTAPGFRVDLGQGKTLFWLSGVPQEMMAMVNGTVMPWVAEQQGSSGEILTGTFKIHGLTESKLDDLVRPIDLGSDAKLSFRAHYPDLTLRLMVTGQARLQTFGLLCGRIRTILGSHVYTEGDLTLEEVVGQLMLQKGQTLALAESCTGGLVSHRITRIPGSSAYYSGGVVTYSNDAKVKFLGVKPTTLDVHGAVSQETALEMSQGIRERTDASIGLSITGVAGPSGGSKEKPVGTVWISIAQEKHHEARPFHFHGERERIILGASQAALNWLRLTLIG
jgi:nicotinamide-nucleotide amidase